MSRVLSRIAAISILLALVLFSGAVVQASPKAGVTFVEPNGSGDYSAEGDDYFSRVLGERFDFSSPDQAVSIDGFTNISTSGGAWHGTSTGNTDNASVFLLFPGFASSAQSIDGKTGRVHPIDSAHYKHLVIKYNSSADTNIVAFWMPAGDPYSNPALIGTSGVYPVKQGQNIIDIDLTTGGGSANWLSQAQWGGLRINPAYSASGQQSTGITVDIDWARLVPATDTPTFTAKWTCGDCATGFTLFADIDKNTSNGFLPLTYVSSPTSGSFAMPTGKLAPGAYYIGAMRGTTFLGYSSGTFTVQAAPVLKINSPSSTSGEDYATTQRGVAWDMRADTSISSVDHIDSVLLGDGILSGTPSDSAPRVILLNNDAPPINTARYKYVTFDLTEERPASSTVVDTVGRVLWYNDPHTPNASGDLVNWWSYAQHYSLDLSTVTMALNNGGWTGMQSTFSLEPSEVPVPDRFELGPVRLTGDPQVAAGQRMPVTWQTSSSTGTVSIYYDTTRSNGGMQIASNVPLSQGAYFWNVPSNATPGTYWLRIVAKDGLSQSTTYSNVPFVIKAVQTGFTDVPSSNTFYTYIQNLLGHGVDDGYTDGAFSTGQNASRVTVSRWIVKARGWAPNLTGAPHFVDVAPSDPDYVYVETAFNHGVLSGYDDHTFRPNLPVTRGQMSKMVVNGFGFPIVTTGGPHFHDVPTSNPFYGQIETIYAHHLVSGYDAVGGGFEFRWGNTLTRSQLAKVLSLGLSLK